MVHFNQHVKETTPNVYDKDHTSISFTMPKVLGGTEKDYPALLSAGTFSYHNQDISALYEYIKKRSEDGPGNFDTTDPLYNFAMAQDVLGENTFKKVMY